MKTSVRALVLFAVLLLSSCHAFVASRADSPNMIAESSVDEFLTPEGRFDLEMATQRGISGAIDLSDHEVRMDPGTGEPIFLAMGHLAHTEGDEEWWGGFGAPADLSGTVRTMVVYDGALVLAGEFTQAGGMSANRIVRWDGVEWERLGSGLSGTVQALTIYEGEIVAGGIFTDKIARWDGETWSSVGGGASDAVLSLTVHNGVLVAGGQFTEVGGVQASRIAAWDGNRMESVGVGSERHCIRSDRV